MTWQLPLMQTAAESIIKRVEESTLPGTTVPPSSIVHEGADSSMQFYDSSYWFPEQASDFASDVDSLYMYIFWISLVFFVAIVFSMVYFCIKYRRVGKEIKPLPSSSHNNLVEIAWSVGPSVFLVYMFVAGATTYFEAKVPRPDAEEILVTASRWNWVFTYPNGDSSSELHLVNNRPTRLKMQSNDVLHSLYIPAFRQKMDIVPGRYTYTYFRPTKVGKYRLSCTEYCGREHSKMRTLAEVHQDDADRKANTQWIEDEYYPWKNGERIYKINCSGCHKINGLAATGPALNLLWGMKERPLMGGGKVKVDDGYVLESIWEPNAKVAEGFGPASKMNSFKNKLDQSDVNQVIAYLQYLNDPTSVAGGDSETGTKDGDSEVETKSGDSETATKSGDESSEE